MGGLHLKGIVEQRAIELAEYIVENKTTVRAAAKKFGISKRKGPVVRSLFQIREEATLVKILVRIWQ